MARAIRTNAPLVFRNNEFDLRTEQFNGDTEDSTENSLNGIEELSPFQRVKQGSRECFLAAKAFPIRTDVN
jgi:hypothetical protein